MGQKTNPLCFRLNTTQSHHSIWFEEPNKYSMGIQEDQKIRNFFKNYVEYRIKKYIQIVVKKYLQQTKQKNTKQKNKNSRIPPLGFEGIVRIEIQKQGTKTQKTFIRIIIYSGFVPKFLLKGKIKKNFQKNIKKQEFYSINPRKIRIELKKAQRLYSQPNLLAEFIALQLKNRVPFRKTMKQAIDLARQTDIKGIKLKLAGRIDGKDIARKEGKRKGKLPLQRICAKIDYCSHTIQTIYGILGLKIWIFRK
uniref:ribosomal protein S3 n=1 Tax=Gahnia tristis TaxID=388572 RepID=UPI001F1323AF|nr:ribosomal protein S3 [Gahnia tristis]ULQ66058.1 ribosomal protein S3 [Gahnia tristis]